ncbi:unnamed protein product [Urochloa humidicola]
MHPLAFCRVLGHVQPVSAPRLYSTHFAKTPLRVATDGLRVAWRGDAYAPLPDAKSTSSRGLYRSSSSSDRRPGSPAPARGFFRAKLPRCPSITRPRAYLRLATTSSSARRQAGLGCPTASDGPDQNGQGRATASGGLVGATRTGAPRRAGGSSPSWRSFKQRCNGDGAFQIPGEVVTCAGRGGDGRVKWEMSQLLVASIWI